MASTNRKAEIAGAALDLIHESGIQELTMKRIAAVVGISEPALYKHFPSKSAILAAVVDELEAARGQALSAGRSAGGGPREFIAAFFMAHARQFAGRPALVAVLFSDDLFRNDQTLSGRVAAIIAGTQEQLSDELAKGKKSGIFRTEADDATAALMLAGGFRLLVSTWRLTDSSFDLVKRTEHFLEQALTSLRY